MRYSRSSKPIETGLALSGLLLTLGALALTISCAGTPERSGMIEEARSAVLAARHDPAVAGAGAEHVKQAERELAMAERLWEEDGRSASKMVYHHAYLARRHAEIASKQAELAAADEVLKSAELNRKEALLRGREREAAMSERKAAMSMKEAESMGDRAEAAQGRATMAEQRASELEKEMSELEKEMSEMRELGAKRTERGLVVTLGDEVLFDFGKSSVKPGAGRRLDKLSEVLNRYPNYKLSVEGHTDSVGSESANEALSERRADAVREALVSNGVDASRIDVRGLGENYPVASNDSNAGRQDNRRVEIIIADDEPLAGK